MPTPTSTVRTDLTDALEATEPAVDVDLAAVPEPFLRITGTFPAGEGRVSTIEVAMNPGDVEPLGEEDDDNKPGGPITSWFTDFVTGVITSMRCAPESILLSGSGSAVFFADRLKHAEDCDGSCGQVIPTLRPATPDAAAAEKAGE